jgi:flagellar hook assembly protein FlgD
VNGVLAPDGAYRYTITAADQWGNAPAARSGSVTIDSSGPVLAPAAASSLAPTTFSPNGDGLSDKVTVDLVASEAGFVDISVVSAFGQQVRTLSMTSPTGRVRASWDGSSDGGGVVPDGTYLLTMTPRDAGGNVGAPLARQVSVYTAVSSVRSSLPAINPQDPNATAPAATTLSFALAAPATVTWTVSNAAGRSIFTQYLSTPLPPGAYAFEWNGRDQAGTVVAPGTYYSNVLATDGALSLRTKSPFTVGAFAVTSSDTTPARGQTITITAASAEPLGAALRLTILQPGVAPRVVTMTRSGSSYRAAVALRRTTRTGSLVLKVAGTDTAGVASTSVVSFPIH